MNLSSAKHFHRLNSLLREINQIEWANSVRSKRTGNGCDRRDANDTCELCIQIYLSVLCFYVGNRKACDDRLFKIVFILCECGRRRQRQRREGIFDSLQLTIAFSEFFRKVNACKDFLCGIFIACSKVSFTSVVRGAFVSVCLHGKRRVHTSHGTTPTTLCELFSVRLGQFDVRRLSAVASSVSRRPVYTFRFIQIGNMWDTPFGRLVARFAITWISRS